MICIKWEPPELDWITFNTDETVGKNVIARCIGVLRDSRGNWIIEFTKGLGRSNTLQAEL